ncbi:MAG: DNA ligase D, partial [Miltoncostaeaceae bacterium]
MGADLEEYRERRDFGRTPEPAPDGAGREQGSSRFVVQRHSARALHYDLRIEEAGVLRSWAVPKGLPLREGIKRLAVQTEDHPLEYLTFEGDIPEGEYGAGHMSVWDAGEYEREPAGEGELKLVLRGRVLHGHYHLVRTCRRGGRAEWLVFRSGAGPPGPEDPERRFRALRPMLAARPGSGAGPFDDEGHSFELKWDGYRALALVTSEGTELRSRSGKDLTSSYPELADLRRAILRQEAVLDGEVVALDPDGRANFQRLQRGEGPMTYVAFDVLHLDGDWMLDRPWTDRREALDALTAPGADGRLLVSDHVRGRGIALFEAASASGIEGIVAKRRDSLYRPGERSAAWRKIKIRPEGDFVVGAFLEGSGGRRGRLGSVLLGERAEEGLIFRGSAGSGLSDEQASTLWARLDDLAVEESPFAGEEPAVEGARWVRPAIEATVSYAEVTDDGRLRAPVIEEVRELSEDPIAAPAPAVGIGERGDQEVEWGDRRVRLTNLHKVYWPEDGRTKGDLLRHYLTVSDALVPHLAGRAMILKRYPDGIEGEFFFQHNLADGIPGWLATTRLARSERDSSQQRRYAVVDDPAALLWVANLGAIDMNPWQSRHDTPDEPTHVLFDLDPADGLPFDAVVETALAVREIVDAVGLRGYPKTSGGSGMHVFVPIAPGFRFETARLFAQVVGEMLAARRPDLVTTAVRIADRGHRVYLDANQNGRGRSISSAYSVRPRPGAPVSTPLAWEEVGPGLDPSAFPPEVVARRLA